MWKFRHTVLTYGGNKTQIRRGRVLFRTGILKMWGVHPKGLKKYEMNELPKHFRNRCSRTSSYPDLWVIIFTMTGWWIVSKNLMNLALRKSLFKNKSDDERDFWTNFVSLNELCFDSWTSVCSTDSRHYYHENMKHENSAWDAQQLIQQHPIVLLHLVSEHWLAQYFSNSGAGPWGAGG